MNKSKKELIQENADLMRIIAFYLDDDVLIEDRANILEKIKRQKKINKILCMICYVIITLLLCLSSFILGLGV